MNEPQLEREQLELARTAAERIFSGYLSYQVRFREITRRSKPRFERRDWQGAHQDAVERLDLYKNIVQEVVRAIRQLLAAQTQDIDLWAGMKLIYSRDLVSQLAHFELAETFFNSITRQIFSTVGVNPSIEFVDTDFAEALYPRPEKAILSFPASPAELPHSLQAIYQHCAFAAPLVDGARSLRLAAAHILQTLQAQQCLAQLRAIELLPSIFYRNTGAFVVGRVRLEDGGQPRFLPLVFCFLHPEAGIVLDAILMDEDDVSILFSFAHSYFHVETDTPHAIVTFLKTIIPLKRMAELYIAIGFNKHGKTELYRELTQHLDRTDDTFKIARGARGLVMTVFSMDSYEMVFKIIKDRADPPKSTTPQQVMERYDLVFRHDRAGRLVDAQEFEHLRIDRQRFSDELLEELLRVAGKTVSLDGECVVLQHVYTERRLTPLDLFLEEHTPAAIEPVILDYGAAIKDLAASNIFPGDILTKNFGVTRHGRVVFYDYDELCLVTDCKFRSIPQATSHDDEMAAEPWFYVGANDIFPEEFATFLGIKEPYRSSFMEQHSELFTAEFWRALQKRHRQGAVIETIPYAPGKRLRRG